jgi:hypothetical protein
VSFQSCEAVKGCIYYSSDCSGVPASCDTHRDQPSCAAVACSWAADACTGTPAACSNESSIDCSNRRDGCAFAEPACGGEAVACAEYDTEIECQAVEGCGWD